MIGKQLLNYEIKSLIGEGGMGNVYLAEHTSIGRKVAIKELRPELASNDEIRKRFKNEAKVMAQLQHPNIVSLYDYHEDENGLYLIMEYVEGRELREVLKELKEPLSIDRASELMVNILKAFTYAHANGIVHRDVKPANILINDKDEVKVLDFGIAKLIGDAEMSLTKTGAKVGTVYYMSPEQVKAQELDRRSDIYSLGILFYELLAGYCPYTSLNSEYEIYDKIVREPLTPLTESMGEEYADVWQAVAKATQKKVEDRFDDCTEFENAILSKKAPEKVKPVEKPLDKTVVSNPASQPKKSGLSTGVKVAIFGGIAAVLFVLVYFFMLKPGETEVGEVEEEGTFVIVKKLNFRSGSTVESESIGVLSFGDEIELIGDPVGPIEEDDTRLIWQKIKVNGSEGWIASKINSQSTLGSKSDVNDINSLFGGDYDQDLEIDAMNRWALNAIMTHLRQQNEVDKYTFVQHDKKHWKKNSGALIAYHSFAGLDKDDPYDYVVLMENKSGEKTAFFLESLQDGQGGHLAGFTEVPSEAAFVQFNEERPGTYSIDVLDVNYGPLGQLSDETYSFLESVGEIVELTAIGKALTVEYDYDDPYDSGTWEKSGSSCKNNETLFLCYDSFHVERFVLIGSGKNLKIVYEAYDSDYNFEIDDVSFKGSYDIHGELGYHGTLSVYSGSEVIFTANIIQEGCL